MHPHYRKALICEKNGVICRHIYAADHITALHFEYFSRNGNNSNRSYKPARSPVFLPPKRSKNTEEDDSRISKFTPVGRTDLIRKPYSNFGNKITDTLSKTYAALPRLFPVDRLATTGNMTETD